MNFSLIIGYLFSILSQASVLALVTLGITLIFRTSFTTNFAQGMIGTLAVYTITFLYYDRIVGMFSNYPEIIGIIVVILVAALIGFLLGVFIDVILVRKSKYSTPLSKQMITMGIVLIITGLIPTIFNKFPQTELGKEQRIPPIIRGSFKFMISGNEVTLEKHNIAAILIAIVIITLVFLALKHTKWGLGVRTTAANERVASLMGVNTKMITGFSWGIAAAIGALAATLNVHISAFGISYMAFMQVNGFLGSVLGGFGTFYGPILGSIMIPFLNIIVRVTLSESWNRQIVYVIILLIVLIKPVGIFGKKVTKKV